MKNREEEYQGSTFLRVITVILGIVIVIAVLFLGIYFGCDIKRVTIEGNELHDNQTIQDVILNDNYSWNSVYVFLKYKLKKPETIPFVDTVEVSLKSPTEIVLKVYEKDIIGFVYVASTGQNAYIDKDGIVEELSTRKIDDVIEVEGPNVSDVKQYKPLETDNESLYKNLLALTNTLEKYDLRPKKITVTDNRNFTLSYGKVKVSFGTATNLNEKIVRLEKILPQVEGLRGTLHMEEWTNEDSDITFRKEKRKEKQ